MSRTPKKKKGELPSGNVRVQVYDYTDSQGKRHYKSFTGATRKEAQEKANRWKILRDSQEKQEEDITVSEAVARYIEIKSAVLSPATHREYLATEKRYFADSIGKKHLSEVKSASIQIWISDLTRKGLSPKTVRNAYGLLSATLDMFAPDLRIKVTLPQRQKPDLYCPNDEDIKKLLEAIKGTELELAVLLAAFGPLRRGEICALTDKDIVGNTIKVRHSMVMGPDKIWSIKPPKTTESERDIEMPDFVIEKLKQREGRLIKMSPDAVTRRFTRALNKIDIPKFRFHDLRHYAASIMHAIGVPDQYILQRGGWSSDGIMRSVYRNVIDLENIRQTQKINNHFSDMQHEMQHDTNKAL